MINNLEVQNKVKIEDMIYEVRGKQVMLDSDLAKLFNYETKSLNRQVQRNIERFPESFCFQLTKEEFEYLRCQNGTSREYGGRRYLPYVFTEHGVTMLAGILKSKIAITTSIKIVNAFVAMKKYISNNLIEQQYYKNMLLDDHNRINLLEESFNKLNEKEKVSTIFFKGQIYDAYSLLMDILSKAKKEIIIIDDYAGNKLLNILKDIDKKIIIVTNNIDNVAKEKYEKQYSNVEFIKSNLFHDRFIIIDRNFLYHSGASYKDLGNKCFAICKMEDKDYINKILENINIYFK